MAYLDEFKILLVHLTCKGSELKAFKVTVTELLYRILNATRTFTMDGGVSAGVQGLEDSLSAVDPRSDGINPCF